MNETTIVLKFGGSILRSLEALDDAVHEIYRWRRSGSRVAVVVSAFEGTTDRFAGAFTGLGDSPDPEHQAALLATGEAESVARLCLALDAAGIPCRGLRPHELGLRLRGDRLDATPLTWEPRRVGELFASGRVAVLPGFVGEHEDGSIALLGRGGSDLSSLALAHALDARCRLIKDVPGWFDRDPAREEATCRRYATLSFDDAVRSAAPIVQGKAVTWARERGLRFEVAGLGQEDATLVGADLTSFAIPAPPRDPLKLLLLGAGVVGRELIGLLLRHPRHFELTGIVVRDATRARPGIPPELLRHDPRVALRRGDAELRVELLGETSLAEAAVLNALQRGESVVSANKALLSRKGEELQALAAHHGADLRFSAAVGGSVPMLETVSRLVPRGIRELRGILSGSGNFLLDALRAGASWSEALSRARTLGLLEADPRRDLEGHDVAAKLALLLRAAGIPSASPCDVSITSLAQLQAEEWRPDAVTPGIERQIARASLLAGGAHASVTLETLTPDDPLAAISGSGNALEVTCADGSRHLVFGAGAGGRPTAEAVLADLFDLLREREGAEEVVS